MIKTDPVKWITIMEEVNILDWIQMEFIVSSNKR